MNSFKTFSLSRSLIVLASMLMPLMVSAETTGNLVYYSTLDSADDIRTPSVGSTGICWNVSFEEGVKGKALVDPTTDGVDVVDGVTWYYTLTNGHATVVKGDIAYAGALTIPATLDGHPVVATAVSIFQNNLNVTSVVFPESVRSIGGWAFDQATNLVSVTLPTTLDYLGDSAFSWCAQLTNGRIPAGLTRVEKDIFHTNRSMTSATVPEGVKSMGRATFYNCSSLKTVTFPTTFTSFDYTSAMEMHMQFGGCTALEAAVFFCAEPPANLMRSGLQLYGKIYYPKANAAAWEAVVPEAKRGGYAEDYGKSEPITVEPLAESYEPGLPIEPIAIGYTGEEANAKISVKGLPKGCVYKNGFISGTSAVPGSSVVKVSVTVGGQVVATRAFNLCVDHYTDGLADGLAGAYGPFVPGVPVSLDLSPVAGWKASGLPKGLKFNSANGSVTGKPTVPGTSIVYFKRSVGMAVHVVSTTFTVAPLRKVTVTIEGSGSVKGVGGYAANSVAKLTAKPGKGFAVAGWYKDGVRLSREAGLSYQVGADENQQLVVKFVRVTDDAASLTCTFDGVGLTAAAGATLCVTNYQGVAAAWPIAFDALAKPSLKVSGLPTGLTFKGGRVTGVPTVASKLNGTTGARIPTKATLTLKTAAGNEAKYRVNFVVLPREAWAVGTYTGAWIRDGALAGAMTFTLAAKGSGSGRLTFAYKGKAVSATLTSASLAAYDPTQAVATLEATLKGTGVTTGTVRLSLYNEDGVGWIVASDTADSEFELVQNVWKRTDVALPTFPTGRAALKLAIADGVTLTFGEKGVVKFAGSVAGDNGTPVPVSGSTSVQAVWDEETGANGQVLIYVPAKKNLVQGFAKFIQLRFDADEVSGVVTSVSEIDGERSI